jgi:hypothetical protein
LRLGQRREPMRWRDPASAAVKTAILASFHEDASEIRTKFAALRKRDWQGADFWLYSSGLSLYFLELLIARGLWDVIPQSLFSALHSSQMANSVRNDSMLKEFAEINTEFLSAAAQFANLKGFTLSPDSCPRPELRHQIDLDFLVAPKSRDQFREQLEGRGYRLSAATRTTWEFKAGGHFVSDVNDRYEATRYRAVELHFSPDETCDPRLERLDWREIAGVVVPTLAPADQLIGQALHLLGHLRGDSSTRASWLLEFRRHVVRRNGEAEFWSDVERLTQEQPLAQLALAVAARLSADLFGDLSQAETERRLIHAVPLKVAMWARHYGREAVIADFPGTKRYLLLEQVLADSARAYRYSTLRRLFPLHVTPRVLSKAPVETRCQRLGRNLVQAQFILFRLRFHCVEGLRYLLELPRWKLRLSWTNASAKHAEVAPVQ